MEVMDASLEHAACTVCDEPTGHRDIPKATGLPEAVRRSGRSDRPEETSELMVFLGLQLPGRSNCKWYPVASDVAQATQLKLGFWRSTPEWIIVETLNNRVIAFRPKMLKRVSFIFDPDDWPLDECKSSVGWDMTSGLSLAVYNAMAEWADDQLNIASDFHKLPVRLRRLAFSALKGGGFASRPAELQAMLRHTSVHFTDGKSIAYRADQRDLVDICSNIESDHPLEFVQLSSAEGEIVNFFPAETLNMIEMSRIELQAERDAPDSILMDLAQYLEACTG